MLPKTLLDVSANVKTVVQSALRFFSLQVDSGRKSGRPEQGSDVSRSGQWFWLVKRSVGDAGTMVEVSSGAFIETSESPVASTRSGNAPLLCLDLRKSRNLVAGRFTKTNFYRIEKSKSLFGIA